MQLSRARSNTVAVSPSAAIASPPVQRPSGDREETAFSALSRHEEHDLSFAQGVPHVHGDPDEPADTYQHPGPAPEAHLNHLSSGHDPSLLVSMVGPEPDDTGGLPMYQASVLTEQQQYDFSVLEAYSREEKTRLGIHSPGSSSSPNGPLSSSLTTTSTVPPPPTTNGGVGDFTMPMPTPRARQRKLSTSAPGPRRAKMALFEHNAGGPPPTLGFRPTVDGGGQVLSAVPSFDNLPATNAAPDFARQNTGVSGHDRPYRFSFYSNALSATIHARSLSELPAEGQTFEELFLGVNHSNDHPEMHSPPRPGTSMGFNGVGGLGATQRLGAMSPLPPHERSGLSKMSGSEPRSRLPTMNGPGASVDGNTWWLDIQTPTDEEMKLLSKVCAITVSSSF
jgi:magnesium transporter